jgi:FPC/CPF motif-containing protein YcgG
MVIESFSPDKSTPLWRKQQIEAAIAQKAFPIWVEESYAAFTEIIRRENFPCFFGTIAEQKEMIRYAIAPSLTEPATLDHILAAVYQYLAEEKEVSQCSTVEEMFFLTLVIFLPPEPGEHTLEDYAQQSFEFLNALHQQDPSPWPSQVATDPQDPKWRYCLGGESLFVNVCTEANHKRRSRHLGPGITLVMNPDDLFAKAWERWGEQPRREIYHRVQQYDDMPPYPLVLPWDKEEERHHMHAKVTALPEDNDAGIFFPFHYQSQRPAKGECPFHS